MNNEPGNSALSGRSSQPYVVAAAFCSLLSIVGFALSGLPFFYDFFIEEFGWSRTVVTSGNAPGKLLVAPLFGSIAGNYTSGFTLLICVALICALIVSFLPKGNVDSERSD